MGADPLGAVSGTGSLRGAAVGVDGVRRSGACGVEPRETPVLIGSATTLATGSTTSATASVTGAAASATALVTGLAVSATALVTGLAASVTGLTVSATAAVTGFAASVTGLAVSATALGGGLGGLGDGFAASATGLTVSATALGGRFRGLGDRLGGVRDRLGRVGHGGRHRLCASRLGDGLSVAVGDGARDRLTRASVTGLASSRPRRS